MSSLPRLPDPRRFIAPADAIPSPLHTLVQTLLGKREPGHMVAAEAALDAALHDMLSRAEDPQIAQAIMHSADLASQRILTERHHVVAQGLGVRAEAVLFALPIVLVAGVRGNHNMPANLPDIGGVKALLVKHDIFKSEADIHLGKQLLSLEQLQEIAPSRLMRWRETLQYAGKLAHEFAEQPISVNGDGVFLRFLVGTAMQAADSEPVVRLNAPREAWSMALSKLLGEQLKHDSLTLFPIPLSPYRWLTAMEQGRQVRQEVRFQVFVSNALRKLRDRGETPVAVFSCHEGDELRVTLGAATNGEEWEGFVWPLTAQDEIDGILQMMVALLNECHHQDCRFLPEVLPSLVDQLPYFPLPTELAERALH